MKQLFVYLIIFLPALSCNTSSNEKGGQIDTLFKAKDTIATITSESGNDSNNNWLNNLVFDYIRHSNQELIKSSLEDTSMEEVWVDQGMDERNSSTYYMCQIGHHLAEKDGSDPRFATDGWVYVDSAKRILYEYDLPNDSLILWKR